MKLTRKKAIELCILLWEWLAETGKEKEDWPKWAKYKNYVLPIGSRVSQLCWFCEYSEQKKKAGKAICDSCPYYETYGACFDPDEVEGYYKKWEDAKTPRTRKKYAKLFLGQLKALQK